MNNIPTNIPIALIRGDKDTLSVKKDVDRLANVLGDRVVMMKEYTNFDHFGFQTGKDMSWTNDVLTVLDYPQTSQSISK